MKVSDYLKSEYCEDLLAIMISAGFNRSVREDLARGAAQRILFTLAYNAMRLEHGEAPVVDRDVTHGRKVGK